MPLLVYWKLYKIYKQAAYCLLSSGISRFTEGSGRLFCSGTQTWCGVKLRQPTSGDSTCVRPSLTLQLFDNVRGGRRSQARPNHLWTSAAEMWRTGRQCSSHRGPLRQRLCSLPVCWYPWVSTGETNQAETSGCSLRVSAPFPGRVAVTASTTHVLRAKSSWVQESYCYVNLEANWEMMFKN